MENSVIFKPFLEKVVELCKPRRIHIEFQEIPVKRDTNINLRSKQKSKAEYLWRIISFDPTDTTIYPILLEMFGNDTLFLKKIRRVGFICVEGTIVPEEEAKNIASVHYIFGQNIYLFSKANLTDPIRQLCYVDISDLQFTVQSLRTGRQLFTKEISRNLSYYYSSSKSRSDTDFLPF